MIFHHVTRMVLGFVDNWTPTKKQDFYNHLLQNQAIKPIQSSMSYSGDELKMNVSVNEQYATLSRSQLLEHTHKL